MWTPGETTGPEKEPQPPHRTSGRPHFPGDRNTRVGTRRRTYLQRRVYKEVELDGSGSGTRSPCLVWGEIGSDDSEKQYLNINSRPNRVGSRGGKEGKHDEGRGDT